MGADGALGRFIIEAVKVFQKVEKLDILHPGTIGPKTIAALGISTVAPVALAWISEALRYFGLHERRDAKQFDEALRLEASEIPWCGAFFGRWSPDAAEGGVAHKPPGAWNSLRFGSEIKEPQIGTVAVS